RDGILAPPLGERAGPREDRPPQRRTPAENPMTRWLAAAAAALALHAHAQFPNRPITVVIPLAAGDAADTASRTMGEELTRTLKQPVVALNRPGAGGVVAADSVVKAPKDGYTVLFAQNSALTFRPVTERQSTP